MVSLITGGAGFIGSHLAEALLARGEQVIILDDLSTGSIENIDHIRDSPSLHCFFESVMDRRLLAELIDESDVVYHLAAAVGVRRIIESPVRTIETNVIGTEVVLEAAAKRKKLVFVASTSEVYGKNNKVPFCEDDDIALGPTVKSRWSYAASKALDEFLALAYWKEKGLPVIVARFFNAVGPRQTGRYGMVLPTFVGQALDGVPLTVFGTGKQSRCFAYVGDIVRAILKLISTDSAVGEVVNIGNDDEITIRELAFLVRERTGSGGALGWQLSPRPTRSRDRAERIPSAAACSRVRPVLPRGSRSQHLEQGHAQRTCPRTAAERSGQSRGRAALRWPASSLSLADSRLKSTCIRAVATFFAAAPLLGQGHPPASETRCVSGSIRAATISSAYALSSGG